VGGRKKREKKRVPETASECIVVGNNAKKIKRKSQGTAVKGGKKEKDSQKNTEKGPASTE